MGREVTLRVLLEVTLLERNIIDAQRKCMVTFYSQIRILALTIN